MSKSGMSSWLALALSAASIFAVSPQASAEKIYRYQADDGSVVFSDHHSAASGTTVQPAPTVDNSYSPVPSSAAMAVHSDTNSSDTDNNTIHNSTIHNSTMATEPGLLSGAFQANDSSTTLAAPTDPAPVRDCQAIYGLSCAEVDHWQPDAHRRCLRSGSDHCDDPAYLERRYKPRPLAQTLEVAQRAAVRGNRNEARALHELRLLFTDYCSVRVELYCDDAADRKACEKKFGTSCRSDSDVDAVLAKYSELSPSEQARIQQIIKEFGTSQESELTRMFKDVLMQLLGLAL